MQQAVDMRLHAQSWKTDFCWQDAGGLAAATLVGVPKRPLHLPTNYRTHSGILNAAAAVVDILKQYFPMVGTLLLPALHLQQLHCAALNSLKCNQCISRTRHTAICF